MARRAALAAVAAATVALAVFPSTAAADLFAITEVAGPNGDSDLARFAVGSGASQPLPAGVNTGANDVHPSLSPDGKRLAYQSLDFSGGTNRIVVVDLASGTSADLINAFDTASVKPADPWWSDSTHVAVGRAADTANSSGTFTARVTPIDVSGFPNGPFARGNDRVLGDFTHSGRTVDYEFRILPANNQILDLAGYRSNLTGAGSVIEKAPAAVLEGTSTRSFDHPTISASAGIVVIERSEVASNGDRFGNRLAFAAPGLNGTTDLPSVVNAHGTINSRPNFSRDGRYLGFVRTGGGSSVARLFVWDTDTQLLVNPDGIDLGLAASTPSARDLVASDGAIALGDQPLILNSRIGLGSVISFQLAGFSNIGIIVQKVVGHTRVLGHRAPRLHLVGRVPLGHFRKGRGQVRWNRRVNGRPLGAGLYQITVRSLTGTGEVRDLGRPALVRIPAKRHHP